jgi:hypothetical protein
VDVPPQEHSADASIPRGLADFMTEQEVGAPRRITYLEK